MRCTWRRTATLAGLIWSAFALRVTAAPAAVRFASAPPEAAPVRLLAPAGGTVLQAGALAELAWEPLTLFDRRDKRRNQIDEWEAFLSLDGGAHYTVRVTPHLDLGLRRILWQVPPAPSADARLLLRFGDERLETVFELPQRFIIAGPAAARLDLVPSAVSLARGEPARPGQDGVVAWVEGDRHGGAARPVVAAEPPSAQAPRSLSEGHEEAAVAEAPSPPRDHSTVLLAARNEGSARRRAAAAAEHSAPAAPLSILLLTTRQNE